MTILVALLLTAGFALLARAQLRPRPIFRRAGALLTVASLALAGAAAGWLGLMTWFGLAPLAAGAVLLHRSYGRR